MDIIYKGKISKAKIFAYGHKGEEMYLRPILRKNGGPNLRMSLLLVQQKDHSQPMLVTYSLDLPPDHLVIMWRAGLLINGLRMYEEGDLSRAVMAAHGSTVPKDPKIDKWIDDKTGLVYYYDVMNRPVPKEICLIIQKQFPIL